MASKQYFDVSPLKASDVPALAEALRGKTWSDLTCTGSRLTPELRWTFFPTYTANPALSAYLGGLLTEQGGGQPPGPVLFFRRAPRVEPKPSRPFFQERSAGFSPKESGVH
jgi:hypothetical protein